MNDKRTTHTPGPWRVDGRVIMSPAKPSLTVAYAGKGWCAGVHGTYGINGDEAAANSRLIAAAPELLAAAKEVLDWMNRLPIPTTGCVAKGQLLFDAIAKAEGTQS